VVVVVVVVVTLFELLIFELLAVVELELFGEETVELLLVQVNFLDFYQLFVLHDV
jgi:hypothetical protein